MKRLKIAIIGSGSTYTPELIEGLINRKDTLPVKEIALMDIDTRKLNIVGSLAKRMVEHTGLDTKVYFTEDLDEALTGADFVFAQIRVGRLPARILDEKIPLKYDLIGQETTGIGGFFKGLRTVPVLLDIAARMEKRCPDAWMINFSNPSGICAQALLDHTDIKMMGLCNAPIGLINGPLKELGLSKENTEVDYVGLNHLSFVTGIRSGGRDYLKEALHGNGELYSKLVWDYMSDSVRITQSLPTYYLTYYFNPRENLNKLKKAKTTRGEDCMAIEEELLEMYQDAGLYVKPELLSKRGGAMYSEVACSLAESIFTDKNDLHVINTFNNGAIPYLEDDDVVETSAYVGADGAKTIPCKEPGNPYVQGLVRAMKAYERLTVEAAMSGDRDKAIRALMLNPMIVDYTAAAGCFDEMLEAHKAYLPNFFK
jgi:6-phospho-beta-glucosidase